MAFTVNGMGTSVCKAGNSVTWDGQESFDAVEWIVFAYMPIIPIKVYHTFEWNGINFRMVPIRWNGSLVGKAFLRRWLWGVVALGAVITIIGCIEFNQLIWFIPIGLLIGGGAGAFLYALGRGNRGRHCDIRRVLGPHNCGTSDPAVWNDALLEGVQDATTLYQAGSFAEAAPNLLKQRRFADAMWAARLCVALEDAAEGERLTDDILDHDEVQDGLAKIGDKSKLWQALFAPVARAQMPQPEPAAEEPLPITPMDDGAHIQDRTRRGGDSFQQ